MCNGELRHQKMPIELLVSLNVLTKYQWDLAAPISLRQNVEKLTSVESLDGFILLLYSVVKLFYLGSFFLRLQSITIYLVPFRKNIF